MLDTSARHVASTPRDGPVGAASSRSSRSLRSLNTCCVTSLHTHNMPLIRPASSSTALYDSENHDSSR